MISSEPVSIKLVVVGDGAVGKTCVLSTYSKNKFPEEYVPTIFDNTTTTIKVNNTIVNLSLWDTAGQEEYERLRPLAYPNAHIFFILFSVIEKSSFTNAVKKWFPEVDQANPESIKVFVGNKVDLRGSSQYSNSDQIVFKEAAQEKLDNELGCRYFQCSALTMQGIKECFEEVVRMQLDKMEASRPAKAGKKPGDDNCCEVM